VFYKHWPSVLVETVIAITAGKDRQVTDAVFQIIRAVSSAENFREHLFF
jgi:hypothetical protein